jgi:Rha family phage regulatory protein
MNLQQSKNYPAQLVFINGQQTITNSLIVADYFGKKHCDVLHKIDRILVDAPSEFTSTHFCVNVQNQQVGTSQRDLKCYHLTKDGFMFLVMGFTGAKAAELKINFINAFNEAQKRLYMREPRFLSLEQLLEISEAANQQIATLARLAEKQARLR